MEKIGEPLGPHDLLLFNALEVNQEPELQPFVPLNYIYGLSQLHAAPTRSVVAIPQISTVASEWDVVIR